MTDAAAPLRNHAQSRVGRTLLINLALIGIFAAGLLFLTLSLAIEKSFATLEERDLHGHLGRVDDFQKRSLTTLVARSKDWSIWDDSYAFAQTFTPDFVQKNVTLDSFKNALVDGMAVLRYSDNGIRSFAFDRETGEQAPAWAAFLKSYAANPAFIRKTKAIDSLQSFVTIKGELFAISAVHIHRSDGSGAVPGSLIFIQKISSQKASEALQVPADIVIGTRLDHHRVAKAADSMTIFMPFKGDSGQTVAEIRLHLKRQLTAASRELLTLTFGGVGVLVLVMLVLLSRRIKTLVLDPVERLHAHVAMMRETGELHLLEGAVAGNELGALQSEFNRMTVEMQHMRAQLESQSFTLGKTQTAVGLMHNLRNCLSPVRVILELLEKEGQSPLPAHTPRALQELLQPALPLDRREKLVAFLSAGHDHVDAHNAMQRGQVREAARNLMNAFAAIDTAAQDRGDTRFDERCSIAELLSHSGNVVRYTEGEEIAVNSECDGQIIALGNRVLLSQVLENLVTNAMEAIRETGRGDGAILLRAAQDQEGANCRISIVDNGAGFSAELGARLFERDFSTRTNKSGGLGLHWCANMVAAMSGTLTLESPGNGLGARATITLPLWSEDASSVANAA